MDLQARNQNLKAFFDRKTIGYDNVHAAFMDSKRALTAALPDTTARVLDLGAGTGLELIPLYERFPDIRVTAVDLSEDMLSVLRTREFADRVTFTVGDFFTADLGEGYDAVISTSALHHFTPEDKVRLYRRVHDALRPGGLFLNADKTAATLEEQEACFREQAENPDKYPHMDTPLTVDAEVKVLTEAGFRVAHTEALTNEKYVLFVAVK